MLIKNLFERDIFRAINGVVKADQLDDSSVWQELDEFVITRELDQHFRKFISWYLEAVGQGKNPDSTGKMGVWISGYFGSGKSHLLKVLSYLLHNRTHENNGQKKRAVEFFESKVKDAMLFADIKRAVAVDTDVILFNIDSKADHRTGRDLILRVFLKVLNELQGYSGDHPHIANMERYLESRGKLKTFQAAYEKYTGLNWVQERDAYQFNRDEVVKALSETLGQSQAAAEKWIDGAEENFSLSVENFCKWVKEYLDSKGPQHRIVFLVDEVGQFIGTDSHLMLNLQTITEELGTLCRRRAWVVVTSQEDMDTVLGDMSKTKKQDFSKIQGRFFPPLSLSSANVDEVIQSRLLAKLPDVKGDLEAAYKQRGDILKSQLTFKNCGMTFRQFKDGEDFVKNYPFAPYQFQLVQRIFEAIRKAGATGMHLARGERSMLDAFQSAAKTVSVYEVGVLVPLYDFYPAIESFLDTTVKKTIDQAETNPNLEPFDNQLLQVLFLIRYVDEMKGNVDNLVTLCLDQIDGDRLALRRRIEESLGRLEKETLIRIIDRLTKLETEPINLTHFNQLLHLNHEAGVTEGFFRYYFLTQPLTHPYPVDKLSDPVEKREALMPGLDERAIWSLNQLKWGLTRLFVDGLLYWGDVRSAFRELRTKSHDDLICFFSEKRINSEYMRSRGPYLPLHPIADTDRYLISEILCKALEKQVGSESIPLIEWLKKAFDDRANKSISVGSLLNSVCNHDEAKKDLLSINIDKLKETAVDGKEAITGLVKTLTQQFEGIEALLHAAYKKRATGKVLVANLLNSVIASDPTTKAAVDICSVEICNKCVASDEDIEGLIRPLIERFIAARSLAAENTRLYLSMVNEMDVYVATSMRTRQNFEEVAKTCRNIFQREGLHRFCVRYFDPTMSIANSPEDKGLIECLMVKCSKVSLYLAGETDSYGKDAEIAMTLSLGKPVVILCPDTTRGRLRESIFRDVHPLSRLIDFQTGVAVGVMVTRDENTAAQVIERVFDNQMEYDLENVQGYYRLKERLTGSIIRLQTNTRLLRESFWNYYHGIQ